eukprot:2580520-Pleurochrysis_carterae.AAC.2
MRRGVVRCAEMRRGVVRCAETRRGVVRCAETRRVEHTTATWSADFVSMCVPTDLRRSTQRARHAEVRCRGRRSCVRVRVCVRMQLCVRVLENASACEVRGWTRAPPARRVG